MVEFGADGPFAILLFQRGADAHEFVAVGGKNGGDHAGLRGVAVDQRGIEVQYIDAIGQLRRGLAGHCHHGGAIDREGAGKFGGEQARKTGRFIDHGRMKYLGGGHDAVQFAVDRRFRALLQQMRGAHADQSRQAGQDQAHQCKREHGNLAADTPVLGMNGNFLHRL